MNVVKYLVTFLLAICTFGLTPAQTVFEYSDSLHHYKVVVEGGAFSGDNDDCSIKTISVYARGSNQLLQTIDPPENAFFCDMPQDQVFRLEDVNFDGLTDFMIVQFIPAGPNIPYYYWTCSRAPQPFQRDTTLEEITSPTFDQQQKRITSFWRASCCDHGISTYEYIDGEITLVEETEIVTDADHPGQQITTRKKRVNGEMKLVERTVEKIEPEK